VVENHGCVVRSLYLPLSLGYCIEVLARPDPLADFCIFVGLDSAPGYRCPNHIVIVPVDGADNLR
jgi:hypothetical protein